MSEPCLEPCPAHLCLEMTKAGMCRHEVAILRADLEQSRARHKMCQDSLAGACAERDSLAARLAQLEVDLEWHRNELHRAGSTDEYVKAEIGRMVELDSDLATMTARAAAAEWECERLRDGLVDALDRHDRHITTQAVIREKARRTAEDIIADARQSEREAIAAWLHKEASAMEFASKNAPTNREAKACDAEAESLRQAANDIRAGAHTTPTGA